MPAFQLETKLGTLWASSGRIVKTRGVLIVLLAWAVATICLSAPPEWLACLTAVSATAGDAAAMSCESTLETLATLVIVFVAALVSSIAGFAFSALAGACLIPLYSDPTRAVEVMVVCSIAIQCYSVMWLWRWISWTRLRPFLLAGVALLPAGIVLLMYAPASIYALGIGAFLLCYGTYMLLRKAPARPVTGGRFHDAVAGALGGITGGLAGFPGAFVAIWCGMRGWSKDEQRSVSQPYILFMQIAALIGLQALPNRTVIEPSTLALFIPIVLIAAHLGLSIFNQLTNKQFSFALHAMLVGSGAALIASTLT